MLKRRIICKTKYDNDTETEFNIATIINAIGLEPKFKPSWLSGSLNVSQK